MAIIKRLSLSVEARTKKASKALAKLRHSVSAVGKGVFAIGAASATGLAVLADKARAAGDRVHKMSKRTGVAVKTLSKMEHAADLSGTSMSAFEVGIKRMSRAASDADNGLSTARRTFDQLGISVTNADGELKGSEALFLESADALSKMENETKKAALAQELFGRSGTQLLPMLENGSKGIRGMMEEAETLGYVFDQNAADAAAKLTDTLAKARLVFTGIGRRLVSSLIPAIERAVDGFVEWYTANREVIRSGILKWGERIAKSFKIISSGAKSALSNIEKTAKLISGGIGIGEWVDGLLDFWSAFQKSPKIAELIWEEMKDAAISTLDFAAKYWINKVKGVLAAVLAAAQGTVAAVSGRGSRMHRYVYGDNAVDQAKATADIAVLNALQKNIFRSAAERRAIWETAYDKAVAELGKPDILRQVASGNNALENARVAREERSKKRRQTIGSLVADAENKPDSTVAPPNPPPGFHTRANSSMLLPDDQFAFIRNIIGGFQSVGNTIGNIATTAMQRDPQQLAYAGAMERGSIEAYQASLARGMDSPEVKETKKSNELLKRIAGFLNERAQKSQEVYEEIITF
jgi:hypothetical protein